jgi:3-hydroxybutyryl-CoA dehydratase
MLGSFDLGISASRRLVASAAHLIIPHNKFSKALGADRCGSKVGKNDQTAGNAMAEQSAFETDFWKDANLRKAWDDIVPGEPRKTIPYRLTREAIELYCKAVGENHPIYFDEAYARTTRYGGLIAPPSIHILLMFSCTPADDWMRSPGTINAGQSWSYNVPARPGDVITLQARALDKFIKRERLFVVHDNVFFNQRGEVICSGRGWTIRPQ